MAFADRSGAAVTVTITGGAHRENSRARWSQHPAHVSASLASQGVGTRTASTEDMGLFQSKRVSGGSLATPESWAGPSISRARGGMGQQGPP